MSDDEYVEGTADSAPADAPGAVPADDDGPRDSKQGGIDSSSVHDAPVLQKQRSTARNAQARKAFAEAILANKKADAEKPAQPGGADEFDPEAAIAPAVKGEIAAAKAAGAETPAVPAAATPAATPPPAPTLDPEVRQLTAYLKAEREKFDAERAEWEKSKKTAEPAQVADTFGLEDYIDSAPRAYRNWLESMRGEKFVSDDEFKREVSDFVTQLSSDVLGVPLPENVRALFDAAQAKKSVRTWKTIQTKREAAQAAKAEQERASAADKAELERVEHEWSKASSALSGQFVPLADVEGKLQQSAATKAYPWLAAEDEPGKVIVDVIRAQFTKDGTQLSWQEASKRANDYLEDHAKKYYDKRAPLLSRTPVAPVAAAAAATKAVPAAPAAAKPAPAPAPDKKWSRERHMEGTKAAFRQAMAAERK